MNAPLRVALPGQAWNVVADDPADLLFAISYGSNPMETVLTAVSQSGRVEWQRIPAGRYGRSQRGRHARSPRPTTSR